MTYHVSQNHVKNFKLQNHLRSHLGCNRMVARLTPTNVEINVHHSYVLKIRFPLMESCPG